MCVCPFSPFSNVFCCQCNSLVQTRLFLSLLLPYPTLAFCCLSSFVGVLVCHTFLPARVKLAILLEGMCSRIANHHLAIPFLRPFMPGIASSFGDDDDGNDYKEEEEEEEEEDGRNAPSAGATHPVQGASVGGAGEVGSSSGAVANGQPLPSRPAAAAVAAGPVSSAGAGANLNSSCAAATGVTVAAKSSKKRATSGGGGSSRSSRANGVVEVGVADAPVEGNTKVFAWLEISQWAGNVFILLSALL